MDLIGMIDLHCHILPGLDDGAKTLDEALEMARIAQSDGIKLIVATPHLLREKFDFEGFDSIQEKRRELNEALRTNNIQIEVKSGAEVHISHNLIDEIRKNRAHLVLNGGSYMFVEFPSGHIYSGVKNLFFDLMSEGITPIIAHPERNSVFNEHPGLLYDLVQMGALAQANSGSFSGLYGGKSQEFVLRLLEWKLVHFIASDGHSPHSIPPRLSEAVKETEALFGRERASALVQDNPLAVLEDKEIPYLPQPSDPRKSRKTFRIRIPTFLKRGR
jgi:protein-tyrosine phosphatase